MTLAVMSGAGSSKESGPPPPDSLERLRKLKAMIRNEDVPQAEAFLKEHRDLAELRCEHDGSTALHTALAEEQELIARRLLRKRNCDVNAKMHNGDTPLHVACRSGSLPLVKLLLRYNADPACRNAAAQRPADVARSHGHQALSSGLDKLLVEDARSQGARSQAASSYGGNILSVQSQAGRSDMYSTAPPSDASSFQGTSPPVRPAEVQAPRGGGGADPNASGSSAVLTNPATTLTSTAVTSSSTSSSSAMLANAAVEALSGGGGGANSPEAPHLRVTQPSPSAASSVGGAQVHPGGSTGGANELAHLVSQNRAQEASLRELQKQVLLKGGRVKKLELESESGKELVKSLETELAGVKKDRSISSLKYAKLVAEKKTWDAKMLILQAKVSEAEEVAEARAAEAAALQEKLSANEGARALAMEAEGARAEVRRLSDAQPAQAAKLASATAKVRELERLVQRVQADSDAADARRKRDEESIRLYKKDLANANKRISAMGEEGRRREDELQASTRKITRVAHDSKTALAELQKRLDRNEAELAALKEDNRDLEGRLEGVKQTAAMSMSTVAQPPPSPPPRSVTEARPAEEAVQQSASASASEDGAAEKERAALRAQVRRLEDELRAMTVAAAEAAAAEAKARRASEEEEKAAAAEAAAVRQAEGDGDRPARPAAAEAAEAALRTENAALQRKLSELEAAHREARARDAAASAAAASSEAGGDKEAAAAAAAAVEAAAAESRAVSQALDAEKGRVRELEAALQAAEAAAAQRLRDAEAAAAEARRRSDEHAAAALRQREDEDAGAAHRARAAEEAARAAAEQQAQQVRAAEAGRAAAEEALEQERRRGDEAGAAARRRAGDEAERQRRAAEAADERAGRLQAQVETLEEEQGRRREGCERLVQEARADTRSEQEKCRVILEQSAQLIEQLKAASQPDARAAQQEEERNRAQENYTRSVEARNTDLSARVQHHEEAAEAHRQQAAALTAALQDASTERDALRRAADEQAATLAAARQEAAQDAARRTKAEAAEEKGRRALQQREAEAAGLREALKQQASAASQQARVSGASQGGRGAGAGGGGGGGAAAAANEKFAREKKALQEEISKLQEALVTTSEQPQPTPASDETARLTAANADLRASEKRARESENMLRTNLEQQLAAAEAAHAQDTASHARKLKKLDERRAEAEAEADALRGRLTKVGFAGSGGKLDGVAPSTSSSGAETEKKRGSAGEEQPNDAQCATDKDSPSAKLVERLTASVQSLQAEKASLEAKVDDLRGHERRIEDERRALLQDMQSLQQQTLDAGREGGSRSRALEELQLKLDNANVAFSVERRQTEIERRRKEELARELAAVRAEAARLQAELDRLRRTGPFVAGGSGVGVDATQGEPLGEVPVLPSASTPRPAAGGGTPTITASGPLVPAREAVSQDELRWRRRIANECDGEINIMFQTFLEASSRIAREKRERDAAKSRLQQKEGERPAATATCGAKLEADEASGRKLVLSDEKLGRLEVIDAFFVSYHSKVSKAAQKQHQPNDDEGEVSEQAQNTLDRLHRGQNSEPGADLLVAAGIDAKNIQTRLVADVDPTTGKRMGLREVSTQEDPRLFYMEQCVLTGAKVNNSFLASLPTDAAEVRSIGIAHNYIGKKGLRAVLDVLDLCRNVESLDLSDNKLENTPVMWLVDIARRHPSLSRINLDTNLVAKHGGAALLALLQERPQITHLTIASNPLLMMPMMRRIIAQVEQNAKKSEGGAEGT